MDNLKQFAVETNGWIMALLRNGLAVFGAIAIVVLLTGARPFSDYGTKHGATAAFGSIRYEGISLFEPVAEADNPQHRALAVYVSRKYKVALDAAEQLVSAAHDAGSQLGIDPLLILAVMAVESRFNPIAESVMGAKGLMQVIPKFHQDKLQDHGGEVAVLDPMTNILVGTRILKDAIRRGGGIAPGLQLYAGAFGDDSNQYSQKVMAEKDRLQQSLRRSQTQTVARAAT